MRASTETILEASGNIMIDISPGFFPNINPFGNSYAKFMHHPSTRCGSKRLQVRFAFMMYDEEQDGLRPQFLSIGATFTDWRVRVCTKD